MTGSKTWVIHLYAVMAHPIRIVYITSTGAFGQVPGNCYLLSSLLQWSGELNTSVILGPCVTDWLQSCSVTYARVSLDHPVLLVLHLQLGTKSSTDAGRYLELKEAPLKITRGGSAIPAALTHSIDVTHSCCGPIPFQAFGCFFPSSFAPLSTTVMTHVDCE